MTSGTLKSASLVLGWTLLTLLPACSLFPSKIEPFTCTVTPSYTAAGQADLNSYTVNRHCLRGIQQRLTACYKE